MTKEQNKIVYSSDLSHLKRCKKCDSDPCQCQKAVTVIPDKTTLKMKIEKNGRGGKLVTLIHDLPHSPDFFEKLTKELKSHCGCGGTYKNATIEIQGDHRDKIEALLLKKGFKVKRSGG